MNKAAEFVAILIVFIAGAVVATLVNQILSGQGRSVFIPSYAFVFACIALAVIQIIIAIRIKLILLKGKRAINSTFAYRILALAKSYIFAGSLLFGFFSGTALWFVRDGIVHERLYTLVPHIAASLIVIAAGIISEFLLRLPKDNDPRRASTT